MKDQRISVANHPTKKKGIIFQSKRNIGFKKFSFYIFFSFAIIFSFVSNKVVSNHPPLNLLNFDVYH